MFLILTTKPKCPFCIKAKELLDSKGLPYEYRLISKRDLQISVPGATTVPQIWESSKLIGGYDKLVPYLKQARFAILQDVVPFEPEEPVRDDYAWELPKKKKTMFNEKNTGYLTGDYPLFFGEDLGFVDTINTPYPVLDELYQQHLSQMWNELEIDLTQDRQDMLNVPRNTTDLVVINLLWQTLVDSVANRAITSLLLEFVSNSDLEAWYNVVALFETIHARTYSHIIKQTFVNPNEAMHQGYTNKNVLKRANSIIQAFNNVANLPHDATIAEKKDAVYLAAVALYMLETVNFMNSFAITFGVAETGVFQGISQDVTLICRDELLHSRGGKEILSIQLKKDPHLATMGGKIQELFDNIMKEEREWNEYLFSEGRQCIGLNVNLSNQYVDYLAAPVAELLGLRPIKAPKDLPYQFMKDYIDSSRVQVAAQELQLTSYLVNAVIATPEAEMTAMLEEYDYGDFM